MWLFWTIPLRTQPNRYHATVWRMGMGDGLCFAIMVGRSENWANKDGDNGRDSIETNFEITSFLSFILGQLIEHDALCVASPNMSFLFRSILFPFNSFFSRTTLSFLQEKLGALKIRNQRQIPDQHCQHAMLYSFSNVYPRPVDARCLITKHIDPTHLTSSILRCSQ